MATWRDAGIFSDRERAALCWAECLTGLSLPGAARERENAYIELCARFDGDEVLALTTGIAGINAWNRIGAGLRFAPPPATGLAAA